MRKTALAALLVGVAVNGAVFALHATDLADPTHQTDQTHPTEPYVGMLDEHPAIQYAVRPTSDRVSLLNRALAEGKSSLSFDARSGYLRAVLAALNISEETQLLVFSKTGVQRDMIGPRNPRAIFFDESVAVGYVPGARLLELAAHDPEQGVVFYTVDQTAGSAPTFRRERGCLSCHVSATTDEVPGFINRSTFARADGSVIAQLGTETVDHRTPLLRRWGGMYVTGNYTVPFYGRVEHMGNVTITQHSDSPSVTTSNEVFIAWTNSTVDTHGYPSSESDIASMMIFDHQLHAMNLLTRLNWETRVAATSAAPDFGGIGLRMLVNELADYLLFVGEQPPPAQLTPRKGFAEWFLAKARKDSKGRSLRDFDMEHRLFRYPCSYMVYSDAFNHLPKAAKDAVYQRMWSILIGRERGARYAHLSAADRRTIIEILRDTKDDLPARFRRDF